MRIRCLWILLILATACSTSKKLNTNAVKLVYQYNLDLNKFEEDQLQINLSVNGISEEQITYCFPKIVPGIYGEMNFGQFINTFEAKDKTGKILEVEQVDTNCWQIKRATQLATINYLVNDGWEVFDFNLERGFYRSAASSFQKEAFVVNTNCLFGYFRDYEETPFEINIQKPQGLYAATSLPKTTSTNQQDQFTAEDYHELVDNPIMYSRPDTAMIHLPNIEVEVACYSTSGTAIAKEIATFVKPLLVHQSKYLNDQLPVDKYTFIIYHNLNPEANAYMGDGLEHSNSTLILLYMPLDMDIIKENVYGIASHEFFHTMMPLGLHSHEIADYDFNDPKFSRHLWLYEGMTEYFTIHMPIKTKLADLPNFLGQIERKWKDMQQFDADLPLTELSLNAMQKQDQYYNVYLKGALLNLCLDIHLRELSAGKYGVQNLILDLTEKYGAERAFEDAVLFKEIVEITGFEEVSTFIEKYIQNAEPLPLAEMLHKTGFRLEEGKISSLEKLSPEQEQLRKDWLD